MEKLFESIETLCLPETSVHVYQYTLRRIPKDCNILVLTFLQFSWIRLLAYSSSELRCIYRSLVHFVGPLGMVLVHHKAFYPYVII